MAEREKLSEAIWFRVEPSRRARWNEAIRLLGLRDSDFYREAIDFFTDVVLDPQPSAAHPSAMAALRAARARG